MWFSFHCIAYTRFFYLEVTKDFKSVAFIYALFEKDYVLFKFINILYSLTQLSFYYQKREGDY